MTPASSDPVLAFLRREAPKAHSADDLAALLNLDRAAVDAALSALHESGEVSSEAVTGYGGSQTVWTARPA